MDEHTRKPSDTWSQKQRMREDIIDAVIKGKRIDVETMLNLGADPNEGEGGYLDRKTLLFLAIENNNLEIAHLLVQKGADLQASITVNKVQKTVVDIAQEKQLDTLVTLIERTTAANQRLLEGVQDGNASEVQGALNFGANVNMLSEEVDEHSLLVYSICNEFIDVAKILITAGADIDYSVEWTDPASGEHMQETPRSLATKMRFTEIIELMERETERRKALMNGSDTENGNANNHQVQTNSRPNNNVDEIEDIEDEDFVELETRTVRPASKRQQKSTGCTIS